MTRDPSDGSVKRGKRPNINALKAKYGDDWGIKPPPEPERPVVKAMTTDQLIEYYRANPERVARLKGEEIGPENA